MWKKIATLVPKTVVVPPANHCQTIWKWSQWVCIFIVVPVYQPQLFSSLSWCFVVIWRVWPSILSVPSHLWCFQWGEYCVQRNPILPYLNIPYQTTLPYHNLSTLPYLPHSTPLQLHTLPFPTLPYPTQLYFTLFYSTLLYSTLLLLHSYYIPAPTSFIVFSPC